MSLRDIIVVQPSGNNKSHRKVHHKINDCGTLVVYNNHFLVIYPKDSFLRVE